MLAASAYNVEPAIRPPIRQIATPMVERMVNRQSIFVRSVDKAPLTRARKEEEATYDAPSSARRFAMIS